MIVTSLLKRLQQLELADINPFDSIEIQIYTFRDLCKFCESFLALRTSNLFQVLLKDFMNLTGQSREVIRNLTSSNLRIIKSASFTHKLPEKELCNLLQKSKNLQKDYHEKDFFFSIEFLTSFLNVQDERILSVERTYFVSCVKAEEEEFMRNYFVKYAINWQNIVSILNTLTKRFESHYLFISF